MNDNARNDAINRILYLNNKSTIDTTVFPALLPPPLPALLLAPDPPRGGSLLKSDNDNEDFEK